MRFNSEITNVAGTSIFVCNGFEFSRVEKLLLNVVGPDAVCFDLDHDGNPNFTSCQSVTFADMSVNGSQRRGIGFRFGRSGYQCDTILVLNCFCGHLGKGIIAESFNTLANQVVGGCFQACGYGIFGHSGTIDSIVGSNFEQNDFDISFNGGAYNTIHIFAVSTESTEFVYRNHVIIDSQGCNKRASAPGIFY